MATSWQRPKALPSKGNAALFRSEIANCNDPGLKVFAHQTLPKIKDHLKKRLF
jgi:hypothetical protein